MTLARSISSCSTQFHASGGWVLNPVSCITKANEQSRKVWLLNQKTVDRLLPLKWEKEDYIVGRLDVVSPELHRLFCSTGLVWLAGWLGADVDSCYSKPNDASRLWPLRLQLSSPDDQRNPPRRCILISASFLGLARKSALG